LPTSGTALQDISLPVSPAMARPLLILFARAQRAIRAGELGGALASSSQVLHLASPESGEIGKEAVMIISLQVLRALALGVVGFFRLAEDPLPGCTSLMVSGFLLLTSIDQLLRRRVYDESSSDEVSGEAAEEAP